MSRKLIVSLVSFIVFLTGVANAKEPVLFIILAGQSNMMSKITISDFETKYPDIKTWLNSTENTSMTFDTNGTWLPLKKGAVYSEYGYEHILAYRVAMQLKTLKRTDKIAIMKFGEWNTALAGSWCPGGRAWPPSPKRYFNQGNLYPLLIAKTKLAMEKLTAKNFDVIPAGFIWYQGEGDACDGCKGTNFYKILLTDLINGGDMGPTDDPSRGHVEGVREAVKTQKMPVVIVRIHKSIHWGDQIVGDWTDDVEKVRAAQVEFATAKENQPAAWINVDDLPLKDKYHFDSKTYITIGDRIAEAYKPMIPGSVPTVTHHAPGLKSTTLTIGSDYTTWNLRGVRVKGSGYEKSGYINGCFITKQHGKTIVNLGVKK